MDTIAILFDIQRSDDREWLRQLREDVDSPENDVYSEMEVEEIQGAINNRFSQLNALDLLQEKRGIA